MLAFVARGEAGRRVITTLIKRTYALPVDGVPSPLPESLPLVREPVIFVDGIGELLVQATDCWPYKLGTDVVVHGSVHAPNAAPTTEMVASVGIGARTHRVTVIGDRRVEPRPGGGWRFSSPEPFTTLPLTFERAYGGLDASLPWPDSASLDAIPDEVPFAEFCDRVRSLIPRVYPRNPVGRGYAVFETSARVDGMLLPNFEDPERLLHPDRLFARRPEDWWKMPLAQGFGWVHPNWYPRCLYFGILPEYPAPDETAAVEEVARGQLPAGQSRRAEEAELEQLFDPRMANGAAPGMMWPRLTGGEVATLTGFAPEVSVRCVLPGGPQVEIRYRGEQLAAELSLHTVYFEPDERRVSLTWGATVAVPAALEYFVGPPAELFEPAMGLEIVVDGHRYVHEPETRAS